MLRFPGLVSVGLLVASCGFATVQEGVQPRLFVTGWRGTVPRFLPLVPQGATGAALLLTI